ncbi:MAG: hypothetical protein ACLP9C_11285 [Acidimicrobiales bacterium]
MVPMLRRGLVGLAVAVAAVVGTSAAPAFGATSNGIAQSTTCKPFTATKWVNPYPPHEAGKHYQVIVDGSVFTCKTADAYVVKFVALKIKASKSLPGAGKVTGGPAGYKCTSGIANNGTAYQGNCQIDQPSTTISSFSWGPYNDS